jgi:hypothetical protein
MDGLTVFDLDPTRSESVIARIHSAPDGPLVIAGDDWAQAAIGALLLAESLAADAGVVPFITLPDGTRGLVSVGAAREQIDRAPPDVRTIYLAIHALVRATHASARPVAAPTSTEAPLAAVPVVVWAILALGVGALVAGAVYALHSDTIEVEGRNARTTAIAATIAALAREQLAHTGHIDPQVWEELRALAASEETRPSLVPLLAIGGLALGGVGGALAWSRWRRGARKEDRA